ncbi:MAG TPA: carboxypeptidase regulatory-like domain-containing protein [Gemmatimonadaceae bacterium]|nr:carboxypeptidase regulatory-like domain-containing protein [Gemmatimonadaceae bacterium]
MKLPVAIVVLLVFVMHAPAFAQGGGASSTGTIQGRITDAQGAVLPGVTVTATSPSMPGVQTAVSSETGNYRFPAVPPGTYEISYELSGFNPMKRSGVEIRLGFTATVNVELALATLQETVTVSGASPIIDTTATRTVQNFKLTELQSIPNARDMWALLAVTPAVQMSRIDVGGNRAGTQTGYTAYGFSGQVRVLIEGINTTEGTGGAGFYFDYSSLDEVFLGTSGQSAEMPNPGVQSQFISKSGGNQFSGEGYLDWYNNALQASNIPDEYTAPTAFNNSPIRAHSNEIDRYYNYSLNIGGPVVHDKVWWFGTYNKQFNAVAQPNFNFDSTFNTSLWNAIGKGTYQVNQKNKFIGYYQWGQKLQPNRLPFSTAIYQSPSPTYKQDSGSWVWKGEWNGTLSDKLYMEARYGDFGYYFPTLANSDESYFWRDSGTLEILGAHRKWQLDRDRKQVTGALTYFLDTNHGSHTLKVGGEILKEIGWEGYEQGVGGNIEHVYNNGRANQVIFRIPTATETGKLGLGKSGALTATSALDVQSMFLNDTFNVGRFTFNGGVRYDRYHAFLPEQQQLGAIVGPITVAAKTFAERPLFTWNGFAPRIGAVVDLSGDGRTVLKANYGFFWHNPGVSIGDSANPNTAAKNATYQWNDTNGDRHWQPGEQGNLLSQALEGGVELADDLSQPYTHEGSVWIERQLAETFGMRAGFVYKTEDDLIDDYQPFRGLDAYTVPFTFTDVGLDGRRGTADDENLTMLGLSSSLAANFPTTSVVMNLPQYSRAKTVELSFNRRYASRWSASIGGAHTWLTDFPNGYPNNPNQPGVQDRTTWNLKATGSYDAPGGVRVSPVLRHQSGANFARTISISAPSGLIASGTHYVEAMDANREDNIWVFDVRAEKTLNLASRTRLRMFFDLFNLANSHASETISRATGLGYLKPSAILAPRTARIGFRFLW